jgi:subtilisin family serine protease
MFQTKEREMRFRSTAIGCAVAAAALVVAAALPAATAVGDTRLPFVSQLEPPNVAEAFVPASRDAHAGFPTRGAGRVRVVVESGAPSEARKAIDAAGGTIERSWRNLVQADLPSSAVPALRRRAAVLAVRAPMRMVADAIGGEEVAASLATAWHAKSITGKGVKVAIIDGGFIGLRDRQAQGDLPANVVARDFCGGRFNTETEHGTAVAEIVHEMAPDAQLYLLCVDTEVDLAAAAAFAKAEGVRVISHSASWFGPDRDDGSGPVAAIAASARAAGILWVNSAGNYAQTHWSGTFVSADGDRSHEYAPGDEGNTTVWPAGMQICGFLKWDEWPAAVSDFDLALVRSGANTTIAVSEEYQDGTEPPFEGLCQANDTGATMTVYWAIRAYGLRSSPRLDLLTLGAPLEYQVPAGSITEPASSPATFAVGALCWQTRQPEYFSSQGPTIDGRTKPDIAGHDSVSGATYGGFSACARSAFAGTSAAAPEVAGAAALVQQAFPAYGPDQLQQYLQRSALDMAAPGMDNVAGAGELQLPKPPDIVPPTSRALASSGRAGKTVRLLSAIADDEGTVSLIEQVKRNGKVAKTIRRASSIVAPSPRTVSTPWQSPDNPKGTFRHCAVAIDSAGNRSRESCATIVLK